MKPDATIRIRLLTTAEGGRCGAITGPRYGCPLMIEGKGFDCRLVLQESDALKLGDFYEVGVKFLNRESAISELHEGMRIRLWEGKTIAVGELITIHPETTA